MSLTEKHFLKKFSEFADLVVRGDFRTIRSRLSHVYESVALENRKGMTKKFEVGVSVSPVEFPTSSLLNWQKGTILHLDLDDDCAQISTTVDGTQKLVWEYFNNLKVI